MKRTMIAGVVSLAAVMAATGATAQRVDSTARASRAGVETSGGAMTLAQLAALPKEIAPLPVSFTSQRPQVMKGKPRIAVPSYSIGFIRTGEARATAGGVGSSMVSRSSKIETYLTGVDDAVLTDLTEEAYQDLVAQLKAAGVDVVSAAELTGTAEFQSAPKQAAVSGGKGKIDSRAEKGWTIHGAKSAPLVAGMGFNPSTMGMMGLMGGLRSLNKISLATNSVMIVPQLGIDYADMESSGQQTWGGSASVSAETRFSINSRSRVSLSFGVGPSGDMGSLDMKGGIAKGSVGTPEPFAVLVHTQDKSDSAAVSNAFAMMGLGNMYNQKNVYAVRADPDRYKALVRAAFRGFNAAIVAEVKKARG